MHTERSKTFDHGFFLNEQELRRLFELCRKRMEERAAPANVRAIIGMKFKNGAVSGTETLDELLAQENIGSKALTEITISVDDGEFDANTSIVVVFATPNDPDNARAGFVRYDVKGAERDWVFVTVTDLDERISLMRKSNTERYVNYGMGALTGLSLVTILFWLAKAPPGIPDANLRDLQSLRESAKLSSSTDLSFALAEWQTNAIISTQHASQGLVPLMVLIAVLTIGTKPITKIFAGLLPAHHFYWGSYVDEYNRRERRRNFFLVTVVVGVIVSVVGSWLYGLLKKG